MNQQPNELVLFTSRCHPRRHASPILPAERWTLAVAERLVSMAFSSPSMSRSGRGGTARAETSSRTLVGLQKANAQLQQELEKIDRQAFTAVSNIANHQQAMKMSWRRLEAQRNSPKPRSKFSSSDSPATQRQRRALLMTSNKTKLYVAASPHVFLGDEAGQEERRESQGDVSSSSKATEGE